MKKSELIFIIIPQLVLVISCILLQENKILKVYAGLAVSIFIPLAMMIIAREVRIKKKI